MKKGYEKIVKNEFTGYGHRKITIEYRDKTLSAVTTDMATTDEFSSKERGWKSAGNRLYNFVVRKNKP